MVVAVVMQQRQVKIQDKLLVVAVAVVLDFHLLLVVNLVQTVRTVRMERLLRKPLVVKVVMEEIMMVKQ